MALVNIAVPKEYGYVLAVTTATFFVGLWQGALAGNYRKATGLTTPQHYAEKSDVSAADSAEKKKAMYLYNCAQRAHGNYNENQPAVALAMLIAGVEYPLATAGLGSAWLVGRILYALGYVSKTQEKGRGRLTGLRIAILPQLGLWGLSAWTGIKMVL